MNGNSYFGNVQFVPGLGYVEGQQTSALGDESSVMMISGLGQEGVQTHSQPTLAPGPLAFLQKPLTLLGITLPIWQWVMIALGLVGAGYAFLGK